MVDLASIQRYHERQAAAAVGGDVSFVAGKAVYSPGTEAAIKEAATKKREAALAPDVSKTHIEMEMERGTYSGSGMDFAIAESIPYGPDVVPVTMPAEKKGFLDWLMGTSLRMPFLGKPPVTPPVAGETPPECLQGLMYDKPLGNCNTGYIPYDRGWGQKELCICVSRYEEAMAMITPPVSDKNGVGKDFGGLGAIVDILPTIVLAAVAVAAMGMFKK